MTTLGLEYVPINTVIPYEVERLNVGDSINLTTGIFTAPSSGRYLFSFIAHAWTAGDGFISLCVNGVGIATSSLNKYNNPVISASLDLKTGDKVDMFIIQVSLLGCDFNGILIKQDLIF